MFEQLAKELVEFDGRLPVQEPVQVVRPVLQPVGRCVRGAPVVVRPGSAEQRVQAQRRVVPGLLAQLHVVVALRVLRAVRVVRVADCYRAARIFRVDQVAAQRLPVELLAVVQQRVASQL